MSVLLPEQGFTPSELVTMATQIGTVIEITRDHRYRKRALAVPGAYWDRDQRAYLVVNPTPRAARAAVTLFPGLLNTYPELSTIADRGLEDVRPVDYATQYNHPLDPGLLEGITLRPWQATDLGFIRDVLLRDGGAQLLWDRGLGKTIGTAALIESLEARTTLVVCRNDAKGPVWRKELERVLPGHEIVVLPNAKAKRERMLTALPLYDTSGRPFVFVVHYEALKLIAGEGGAGDGWDALPEWDLMVFDEGHRLATMNPNAGGSKNTQMGKATMKARRRARMALNLTGTPIMNKGEDMFGQLHFIMPDRYPTKWKSYNDRVLDVLKVGNQRVPIGFKEDFLPQFRDEIGRHSVYRTKAEELDLPPVLHQDIELELLPGQRRAYDQMVELFWAEVEGGALIASNVLAQLNHLRQLATWVEGVPSAKLDFAIGELEATPDEQFVVFTYYKAPGRALRERLGDECVVVDGDVKTGEREANLAAHAAGKARVLVGSIETIGESLNLQYCHEAIRLDRHWNPGKNKQTFDRLLRDGQTQSITFRDLIAVDTVDQLRVQPALTSKESLRKAVFGA